MTTEGIIRTSTTSNHIAEIEQVLGIEAARSTIPMRNHLYNE